MQNTKLKHNYNQLKRSRGTELVYVEYFSVTNKDFVVRITFILYQANIYLFKVNNRNTVKV